MKLYQDPSWLCLEAIIKTCMKLYQDPSWLCLEVIIKTCMKLYQCRMYSRKLLMMGKEVARNT
jgi:hypothetical protein